MSEKGRLTGPGGLSGLGGDGLSEATALSADSLGVPSGGPGVAGQARRGSLSGPGTLSGAVTTTAPVPEADGQLPGESLAQFATRHGLKPAAARPRVLAYIRQLWQRRHFIVGFATARNVAMYTEARLGQLWQVLTPLLNVAVYFLIFGLLLHVNRGMPSSEYLPFLVTGVFVFNFTQRSLIVASRVMHDSLPLIRALYFPRAALPLGYVIIELQQLLLSFAVLFIIVVAAGEPVTWYWLLIIPALMLQSVFNVGVGFLLARWGAVFDDVSQLLPFIVRTWMYASGVIFSIQGLVLGGGASHPLSGPHGRYLAMLMELNPAAVFVTIIRNALMTSQRLGWAGAQPYNYHACGLYIDYTHDPTTYSQYALNSAYCHVVVSQPDLWVWGVIWAVVALAVGFFFFWRAEAEYGRG